jgi:hypothetical protein
MKASSYYSCSEYNDFLRLSCAPRWRGEVSYFAIIPSSLQTLATKKY